MKNTIKTFALAGILVFAASCKKDTKIEENTTTPGELKGLSMKITNAMNSTSTYTPTNLIKQYSGGIISVTGAEGLGGIVSLAVSDTLVVGTYTLNENGPAIIGFSNNAGQTYYRSDMGSIQVITHDMNANKISGKFSGRIVRPAPNADTMMVTEGEFNVAY